MVNMINSTIVINNTETIIARTDDSSPSFGSSYSLSVGR
jgi:hypothetical protein